MPRPVPSGGRAPGLAFNGKFLGAKPTGVHRVGHELLHAIDGLLAAGGGPAARLLLPPGTSDVATRSPAMPAEACGIVGGQLWEQVELPRLAGRDLVVSLCNIGPAARREAVTMIHDAQVYLTPASYSLPFRIKYRALLPLIGRRHRRIVTVSDYSRRELARHGVAPAERIAVVHNGVDHILRTPAEPGALAPLGLVAGSYVVALANTQRHKNIGLLLRAFADPALADTALVLVGGASPADFAAAGHPVSAGVRFAGAVSDGALRTLMEGALALAFPSTTEGFGLPPLEAMLLGCPALVAPCGALPEVCGDAVRYCAADDPRQWVQAISVLRGQGGDRAALAAAGIAQARRFTWAAAGRQLLHILQAELAR